MTFRIETAARGRFTVFVLSGRIEIQAIVELRRAHRQTLQFIPAEVLSTYPAPPQFSQGQHRTGTQTPGSYLSHPQEQLGVRRLPQLRSGLLKTGQNPTMSRQLFMG